MKTFGVKSRTSVTEARRQWGPKIPQELRDRWRDDPEWRESQREFAEELAGWFRAGKPEREKTKCESK
jgi:hypothetical protein